MAISLVTDGYQPPPPSEPTDARSADEILTPADLDRIYKVKQGTQKSLRSRRQIPYISVGGGRLVRYRRSEIEAWLAQHAKPAIGGAR